MLKVGITGGIGSGKSTICRFFETLGAPVYLADSEAKALMNSSPLIRSQLMRTFGRDIYQPDHTLNRKKLAQQIFQSADLLEKVNLLVHPIVRQHFLTWLNKQNGDYVVYEAAILFESGFYPAMDFNILVTAPEEERIRRTMARGDITLEDVKNRMARQWPDKEKMKMADFVIINDNEGLILPQLIELDKKFRAHG